MEMTGEKPWFDEGLRFQCTGCGKCCTGSPGYVYLSDQDMETLSLHFQLSKEEFTKKYTRFVEDQYSLLDKAGSYDCIFLEDNKCKVYAARPVQCKTFPWWISSLETPAHWEEAAKRCEGINHPDAPVIPSLHIQTECLTYLDNVLQHNFGL
jgi:Fe-S-cluster containining protein